MLNTKSPALPHIVHLCIPHRPNSHNERPLLYQMAVTDWSFNTRILCFLCGTD